MRKIAIVNQKGGSGKTTTSVNLAAALVAIGHPTLLIDMDPQHNSSDWLGVELEEGEKGIFEVFDGNAHIPDILFESEPDGVDFVPSSDWLYQVENGLKNTAENQSIIKAELDQLPQAWKFIILDCPPNLGILTLNALRAVDELIVPVEAHYLALSGLAQLTRTIQVVRDKAASKARISGIVACRADFRTRNAEDIIEKLREKFGDLVFDTVIRENVRIAESPSFKQSIISYAPNSHGAWDYKALADEIVAMEEAKNGAT